MNRYTISILAGFILLWVNQSISKTDKTLLQSEINRMFNEPDKSNVVVFENLPQAELNGVKGWYVTADEKQLEILKVEKSTVTASALVASKDAKPYADKGMFQWFRGETIEQIIKDNKLAPIAEAKEVTPK
jgi:hypothetical protein